MGELRAPVSRRRFCAQACQVASGVAVVTVVTACGGASSPTSPSGMTSTLVKAAGRFTGASVQVTVDGSPLADIGGAVLVESTAGVFLVSRTSANAFQAVDAVCSHESCTVTDASGEVFVCPCHGSRYDRGGRVLAGPAKASLRTFATTFSGGVVSIAV